MSFENFHQVDAKALSYTANFKLKVIENATEVGNLEARRFFNVDELNIRLWRKARPTSKIVVDVKELIVMKNLTGQN
ncbi:hypothetical protein TNCV_2432701 [Trichonephila clavipes]|nr:hypothetical protein TNCV_2432701 [Trichonephila clavipes]